MQLGTRKTEYRKFQFVQARLPWSVGVYSHRVRGRLPWQHYVWRLPADAGQRERAHAQLVALCVSRVIPLQLTRQQDEVLRDLCRHPALQVPPETVKFLLSTIVGARPHRSNAKKHKRILELVSDPAAAAEVSDYIAAGFDVTDMRFLNGARDDPAFGPYFASLVEILEERSQLATHDRRHEGADDAMVLRPTPLAASLPALMRKVLARLQSNPEHAAKLASGELHVPSEFALAARMQPSHPSRVSADWHSSTLPIKWALQQRVLCKMSPDSHYVNAMGVNTREYVLELQAQGVEVLYVSDDDKCKISIGPPGLHQTAATRSGRVLAGVWLAAN
jgi:hypothetical protein